MARGIYSSDRQWSDGFIPAMKAIIGPLLLSEAPLEVDCKQAADLVVFSTRSLPRGIACRVRHCDVLDRYPYAEFEFTLRHGRTNGTQTEFDKIARGFGDWMFYGHAGPDDENTIARWFVVDLNQLRYNLILKDRVTNSLVCDVQPNGDREGTSFVWYDLRSFPAEPPILVASSEPVVALSKDKVVEARMAAGWRPRLRLLRAAS